MLDPHLWALIQRYARPLHLDPHAVAAVAMVEGGGRFGAVGDQGTSYGPFQLHRGGALPAGWGAREANSPRGVLYAMQRMSQVAGGLHGRAAVANIVNRFERPAAPGPEIAKAWSYYGGIQASHPVQTGPSTLSEVLGFARHQLGQPYVWGGESRREGGFDCSGLIYAAYMKAGYKGLARTTQGMIQQGQKITNAANLKPGDLIFPSTSHVGIYLGNGRVLSSPHTGAVVHISSLAGFGFLQARRIINGGGGIQVPRGYARQGAAGLPVPNAQGRAAALATLSTLVPVKANLSNFAPGLTPAQTLQNLFPNQTQPTPAPVEGAPAPLADRTQGQLSALSTLHSSLLPKAMSYARTP